MSCYSRRLKDQRQDAWTSHEVEAAATALHLGLVMLIASASGLWQQGLDLSQRTALGRDCQALDPAEMVALGCSANYSPVRLKAAWPSTNYKQV